MKIYSWNTFVLGLHHVRKILLFGFLHLWFLSNIQGEKFLNLFFFLPYFFSARTKEGDSDMGYGSYRFYGFNRCLVLFTIDLWCFIRFWYTDSFYKAKKKKIYFGKKRLYFVPKNTLIFDFLLYFIFSHKFLNWTMPIFFLFLKQFRYINLKIKLRIVFSDHQLCIKTTKSAELEPPYLNHLLYF